MFLFAFQNNAAYLNLGSKSGFTYDIEKNKNVCIFDIFTLDSFCKHFKVF